MASIKTKLKRIFFKENKTVLFLKIFSTVIALFILFGLYKKGVVAPAFVNGQPVTFSEITRILQEKGGPNNAIDHLIVEKVVEYEAKKRNIKVKKEEIDSEIVNIEKEALENGMTLVQLLKESDQTYADLEKNTKLRLTVYKILSSDIEISEETIDAYIDENRDLYKDKDREEIREEVKELLLSQKYQELYEDFIHQAKASTDYDFIIKL